MSYQPIRVNNHVISPENTVTFSSSDGTIAGNGKPLLFLVQQTDWQPIGELLGNLVRGISAVVVDDKRFPIDGWWIMSCWRLKSGRLL